MIDYDSNGKKLCQIPNLSMFTPELEIEEPKKGCELGGALKNLKTSWQGWIVWKSKKEKCKIRLAALRELTLTSN